VRSASGNDLLLKTGWRRPMWGQCRLKSRHFPYSLRFGQYRALCHERLSPFSTQCSIQSRDGATVLPPLDWFPRLPIGGGTVRFNLRLGEACL
jgi:hypothetical protein